MSFVKYSMGGPITSVEDKDTVEKREEIIPMATAEAFVICKKCGIQHMMTKAESSRVCCGTIIKADKLS